MRPEFPWLQFPSWPYLPSRVATTKVPLPQGINRQQAPVHPGRAAGPSVFKGQARPVAHEITFVAHDHFVFYMN